MTFCNIGYIGTATPKWRNFQRRCISDKDISACFSYKKESHHVQACGRLIFSADPGEFLGLLRLLWDEDQDSES